MRDGCGLCILDGDIGWRNLSSQFAHAVGGKYDQPLFATVAPKEYRWDLACWTIPLGLLHPLFGFEGLASLAFNVKRKVLADYVTATTLWMTAVLLGASGLLPALLAQIIC